MKIPTIPPILNAVLATAHISKKKANEYISHYIRSSKTKKLPFKLPIDVQVYPIHRSPADPQHIDTIKIHQNYSPVDSAPAGEDSLFHTLNENNLVFGVCDGVGGWNDSGVDPSVFSRTLSAYTAESAQNQWLIHSSDEINPKDVMRMGYGWMRQDDLELYGSSTILVLSLSLLTGKLNAAQLGDSSFMVYDRMGKKTVFVSPEQQHRFNMPYQLTGKIPTGRIKPKKSTVPFYKPKSKYSNDLDTFNDLKSLGYDTPLDSNEYQIPIKSGNVILAATDGLFDNVHQEEIENVLGMQFSSKNTPLNVGFAAQQLCLTAVLNYLNKDTDSPFSIRAKESGYNYLGGKPDDVTVVLAYINDNIKSKL
ncbi:hypothetical protein BB559_000292 [Furculomyces boomerangus]|uniref:Protein phosphatase n=2 Tax=Harpellales TaxID=61421 RepID=A0A2T9Z5N6_9FUNG|nr:hypothetical protein BB559_000292 [Furculomyces boomerangus]PWA02021.1 hypothetical protein BB558_001842 [Smittium angustum]